MTSLELLQIVVQEVFNMVASLLLLGILFKLGVVRRLKEWYDS